MASKSLGTLTLDLVAKTGGFVQGMDKAERSSEKWRKQVEKDVKVVGGAVGAAAAAVVTGLTAMTVATVKQANEVSKFASLSGTSTEAFQRYAAGASALGIEQEKLADIFKDTQDKVGDFLQTGGGALADFFENIAPQVGVTAEQFSKLSGPEALGLYVSSLEKAGASQSEMTFYLEAIASDATLLLPLLKNNAEGFDLMGDAAARAGAIMDESTIRAAGELSAAVWLAEQSLAGMKNQIMQQVVPTLADLSVQFLDVAEDGETAQVIGDALANTMKWLAAGAMGAYSAFLLTGKAIGGFSSIAAAATEGTDLELSDLLSPVTAGSKVGQQLAKNLDSIKAAASVVAEDLDKTALELGEKIQNILNAGTGEGTDTESLIKKIQAQQEAARKAYETSGAAVVKTEEKKTKAARKTVDVIGQQLSALERAAATWGMGADDVQIYDLRIKGATENQIDHAKALLGTVSALEKQKEQQEAYKDLVTGLRTEEEQRLDTLREQLTVLDSMSGLQSDERAAMASRITKSLFDDAEAPAVEGVDAGPLGELSKLSDAELELQKWYDSQLEQLASFREERSDLNSEWDARELEIKRQHEEALANIERSRWQVGLQGMGDFLTQMQGLRDTDSKKGKQAAKAAAIVQATINAYTAATGAYASASAIPVVGWVLGPVAAAAALAAGLANVASIKGQAHDGIMSVPASGTWNLEKGERVLPQDTAAALDATLSRVQANMTAGPAVGSAPNVTLNQTNNFRQADNRTANQVASATAQKQRQAQARLG